MKKVAQLWDDYIFKSFIETSPYLFEHGLFDYVTICKTLRIADHLPDEKVFSLKKTSIDTLAHPTIFARLKAFIFRRLQQELYSNYCLKIIKQQKADLIHIHFGTTAGQLIPLLRRTKLPTVVIYYGSDVSAALRNWYWRRQYKKMFRHVSHHLVLCKTVKQRLVNLGCPAERITIWNIPAGVEKYPYLPRTKQDCVRFVIAARFIEKKGHSLLLQAFQRLLNDGEKVSLTIIGYGPLKETILADAAALGIESFVTLIDTAIRGDFAKLYNSELGEKDIFVLPATTAPNGDDEGGPALTLVCAQSAGLPVITTKFPGSEITVIEGQTGIYCAENVGDLYEKMHYLLKHPELWNKLGKAASDLVHREFSEKSQMEKICQVYEMLLAGS